MPLVRRCWERENNLYRFIYILKIYFSSLARFDEVDEANPEKKPAVHNVVLAGKRKQRLPFEEQLRPPSGNLTNNHTQFPEKFQCFYFSLFFVEIFWKSAAYIEKVNKTNQQYIFSSCCF